MAAAALLAALAIGQQAPATPMDASQRAVPGSSQIVDLTHPLSALSPSYPGDAKPFEILHSTTIEKDGYFTRRIALVEHFGTHLDAPAHFIAGAATVDRIPAEKLFAPAVVLDARKESAASADYLLPVSAILEWEKRHGRIPTGAIVLMRTGWAARWSDQARYRNADSAGTLHFPGFSVEAVKALIERKVIALGIDTLSVDYGPSKDFAAHKLSHGAGLYHLENVADMSALPESGARLIAAPMKLEGGSGAPVRLMAIRP